MRVQPAWSSSSWMRTASTVALLMLPAAPAVAVPVLQNCEFSDGQVRTLMIDPGAFPLSVSRCDAISPAFREDSKTLMAARPAPTAPKTVTFIELPVTIGGRRSSFDPPTGPFADLVHAASQRYRLDAKLLHAIIRVESNGNPRARSSSGALGLMQVMPGTGARYGVRNPADLMRPEVNIDVGARYLSDLRRMFGNRIDLVAAAYNAGEGAVLRYGRSVPPFVETQDYVQRVLARLGNDAKNAP